MREANEIVSICTQTIVRFADHERCLVFVNDSDAIRFDDWWHAKGEAAFVKYTNQQEKKK